MHLLYTGGVALTADQIQAQIDALDKKIASGATSVAGSDGKRVDLDEYESLMKRRAFLQSLLGGGTPRGMRRILIRRRDC